MLPGHLASAVPVLQGIQPDGDGHAEVVRVPVAEVGAPKREAAALVDSATAPEALAGRIVSAGGF